MQKRITIMEVPLDIVTKSEVLDSIFDLAPGQKHIITVNPEMILAAQDDEEFMDILQKSSINTADGTGILWAANAQNNSPMIKILKLLKLLFKKPATPLPELIKGSDLTIDIAKCAASNGTKIFLLGAQPGIGHEAKHRLEKNFPGVKIVGTHSGSPSVHEEEKIKDQINEANPDILLVAYGAPAQEKWIARNLHKIPSVRAAIGIGGTLDYISGHIKRAPLFLQNLGLEWLYRLISEPKRWKRIRNATVVFPWKFLHTTSFPFSPSSVESHEKHSRGRV